MSKDIFKKAQQKHSVFHKFCEWCEKEFGENWENPEVLSGHEVMQKIEQYAKKNPQISIAYCDDDLFATSLLVIIPHQDMGNTIIFVPQLTCKTNKFFLYPNHQQFLLEALNKHTHKDRFLE